MMSVFESESSVAVWFSILATILILSVFWSATSVALITRSVKFSDADTTLLTVIFTYYNTTQTEK